MSFGGGSQYTLEYLVKVTNQGGTTGLSQINTGLKQVDMSLKQTSMSAQQLDAKLEAAKNKMNQAVQTQTKALKGLAFGILGATTAGAEFAGMWGMHVQVSEAVKEAQGEVNQAIAEYGEESSEAKKATQELTQAKRWESMVNRNLMLSTFDIIPFIVLTINGMVKEKNAIKELGIAKKELAVINDLITKSNIGVAASNKVVDGSYVTAGKSIKTFSAAQSAANVSTLASAGAFTNTSVALGTATKGMDNATKAAGRTTKAMRVLSIAMKIAIPLIALEIGAQAYERNWMGFRDRINEAGEAIGNAIPAMKGFLDVTKKVGESVVAIFTGNWDRIGSIWEGQKEGAKAAGEMSENARKKIEELKEEISEFQQVGTKLLVDASQGDKGEQRDLLKSLGIKGNEKEKMRDFLDTVEDAYSETQQAASKLEALEGFSILEKLGFDIPEGVIEDIQNTLDSDLRDVLEGDNDPFNKLAEILEDSPNKEKYGETLKKWVAENPGLMEALKKFDPRLASAIEGYVKMLEVKTKEELAKAGSNVANAWTSGEMFKIKPGDNVATTFDWSTGRAGDYKKEGSNDMFSEIKTQFKNFSEKDLPTLVQGIKDVINNPENWKFAANIANIFIVDVLEPIMLASVSVGQTIATNIYNGMVNVIEERKNAGKYTPEEFIKVLFSGTKTPKGDQTEFEKWLRGNETIQDILEFISNPFDYIKEHLRGNVNSQADEVAAGINENQGFKLPTLDDIKKWLGIDEFIKSIQSGYAGFVSTIMDNQYVKSIASWINDPIGSLMNLIKNVITTVETTKTQITFPTVDDIKEKLGITALLTNLETIKNQINADPLIQWAKDAWNAIKNFDPLAPFWNEAAGDKGDSDKSTPVTLTIAGIDLSGLEKSASEGTRKIYEIFMTMVDNVAGLMNMLGSHWSMHMNHAGSNAESGADQIYDALRKAFDKVINDMSSLASHWSSMMNSLGANARSAAKQVNKALDSIEDEEVVITYVTKGEPKAKGGIMSFANGGVMSAATGKLLTTYGPRLFQIGDNPGGRESIWAIPHNSPGRIVRQINKMYGSSAQSGGTTVFNGQVNLKIDGNSIINDIKLNRRVQLVMGDDMDRYGP